ncbi:DUF4166 domain-containing protein [Variovorax sp. J22R133]|uniref:DUF4166 domain-containing protein n=1 Tax=Variovorax brevis TaxID=3053503 RepID=UPI002578A581|nr:DUF4166 domain-containing protein [Variovorax sp. J22R133]MDM0113570.1 DUF4166 domain-containing protein [Variovorax sp. J22R133]
MTALSNLLPHLFRSTPTPVAAPLDLPALVGAEGWARLPANVQRRFGVAHGDTAYAGHLELRCSPIGRLFARMAHAFGGPLTRTNASDMPTTVRVHGDPQGGMVWERCFHRASLGGDRMVRSTKEMGPDGGLRERTDGGLTMTLDVFEEAGSLVFQSRRFALVRGRWRIGVPMLLTPGTCRVVHTDLGGGLFRFTLTMVHPLWGQTFFQSGVFTDPVACES